ncbi:MAG: glycoside hydrolase family 25 protein [Candidatus Limnocylindrales bacterium]
MALAAVFLLASPAAASEPSSSGVGIAGAQGPLAGVGFQSGIDVSHWQGYIDWRKVGRTTIDFAIAKATEGTYFVDGYYHRNKQRAEAAGLHFTAYHFANPSRRNGSVYVDARREADWFLQHADLEARNLVPALDLERTGGLGRDALRRWTLAWLGRVEARLDIKPMIYTSPSFWANHLGNTQAAARQGYEVLWVAHWRTHRPWVPARRWNGHGWTLWQWTDCGRVSGIRSCVDRDYFGGDSLAELTIRESRLQRR